MGKKWVGLALVALWLGQGTAVRAQYLPSPIGAARLPDPAPVTPGPQQPEDPRLKHLIPGPLTPELAPCVPQDDLTLPENHDGAFQAEEFAGKGPDFQIGFGAIALWRQGLGNDPLAFVDSGQRFSLGRVNVPVLADLTDTRTVGGVQTTTNFRFPTGADVLFTILGFPDDGRPIPAGSPSLGESGDLGSLLAWGFRGSAMLIGDSTGLEISGFAVSPSRASTTIVSPSRTLNAEIQLQQRPDAVTANPLVPQGFTPPNPPPVVGADGTTITFIGDARAAVASIFGPQFSQLDAPFFNAPAGFEGNNGLWLQADTVSVSYESSLASIEFNARRWSNIGGPWEGFFGIRYFDHEERLDYTTVDDFFQDIVNPFAPQVAQPVPVFSATGFPFRRIGDPTVTATYSTRAHNRIIGPQIGFEGHLLPWNWLALSYTGKAMAGVNLLEREVSLVRGDGLIGFQTSETLHRFSHAYEIGLTADISLLDKARLRAGYNLFWLVNVATALGQLDYNLANPAGDRNNSDAVFYHGPSLELQFIF